MSTNEKPEYEKLVDTHPEWFEQFLLVVLLRYPKVFRTHMDKICGPKTRSKDWKTASAAMQINANHRDFRLPAANFLFCLARQYYVCSEAEDLLFPYNLATSWAQKMEESGDLMPRESETISQLYYSCLTIPDSDVQAYAPMFTAEAILYWLQKARVRTITEQVGRNNLTLNSLEEIIGREKAAVGSATKVSAVSLGAGIGQDEEEEETLRIPSPWYDLNKKMGGGFPVRTYTLIGGATDAGKTSVATQITGHAAKLGYNVLFITTEDPLPKIQGRILSNLANVPYELINEKVVPRLLPENHRNNILKTIEEVEPRLRIVDWALELDVDVTSSLGGILNDLDQEGWVPDMIVLDWIGGAMGELNDERLALLRHIMMRASNFMANVAKSRNVASVATCQLDPKKGYNRKAVSHVDVAENKKLAVPAQYFLALTGMLADENEENASFQEEQFFNITKCKGAKGGKVKLKRALHYQRFL